MIYDKNSLLLHFSVKVASGKTKPSIARNIAEGMEKKIAHLKKYSDLSKKIGVLKTWTNKNRSLRGYVVSYLVFLRDSARLLPKKIRKYSSTTYPFRDFFLFLGLTLK